MTRHPKSCLIVPQFIPDCCHVHGYYNMKINRSLQFLVGPHLDQLFQNDDYQIVLGYFPNVRNVIQLVESPLFFFGLQLLLFSFCSMYKRRCQEVLMRIGFQFLTSSELCEFLHSNWYLQKVECLTDLKTVVMLFSLKICRIQCNIFK